MGNESSHLSGLEIEEKAVEVTDFWVHSSANLYNDTVTSLSVFIGESFIEGPLWTTHTPLEKMTKNLMLHRHPCILKYVSSWSKGSKHYLAVEQVKPLAHVIGNQTTLQLCLGLYSILKALTFLHEKALSSHNNLCSSCIYVARDGSWKLGGLEYLCRLQELSAEHLARSRTHRYDKAIHPSEQNYALNPQYLQSGAIDKYAFGVLVHEILHISGQNDNIPYLEEFKQFCKSKLQDGKVESLPSFSSILEHPYFSNDFIIIYSFLTELALKNEAERRIFFTELGPKLRAFPEDVVAEQLADLLLSRLVLLDETACKQLLPFIFKPATEETEEERPIFSIEIFKQYIVPKLLHIFCVRDAEIRLLLLNHFKSYINYFTKEQLQNHILPELLIGIKDTNDHLVSVTLIALSDLVPLLGAATVIGGKRLKLFNDGRPNAVSPLPKVERHSSENNMHLPLDASPRRPSTTDTALSYSSQALELPERLSPDGGEDEIIPEQINPLVEEDLDNWSDWDAEENNPSSSETPSEPQLPDFQPESLPDISLSNKFPRSQILTDISTLDIKTTVSPNIDINNEFDYFLDMEPVIEKTNKIFIEDKIEGNVKEDQKSQISLDLRVAEENQPVEDCWGEDLSWAEK